jgi:hypothetical protein
MIKFVDKFPVMRGEFRMWVYRKGILVDEYEDHNIIVNGARSAVARLVSGDGAGKEINRIAFGVSGAVASPDNTAISSPYMKSFVGYSYPLAGQILFSWDLLTSEANGKSIMEFGLICGDGTLFARKTRKKPLEKDSDISAEGQWLIIF